MPIDEWIQEGIMLHSLRVQEGSMPRAAVGYRNPAMPNNQDYLSLPLGCVHVSKLVVVLSMSRNTCFEPFV